jgi:hypothetical protein
MHTFQMSFDGFFHQAPGSSSVAAAPMHPGKSGTWALYPVDVGAYNTAYFISSVPLV